MQVDNNGLVYVFIMVHLCYAFFFFEWASSKYGRAAFLNLSGGWAKFKIHIWLTKEIFLFTNFFCHWYEKHVNSFDAVLYTEIVWHNVNYKSEAKRIEKTT